MADAVGGGDGQIKRDLVSNTRAVAVRDLLAGLRRQFLDLQARAMHQDHTDAQAAQEVNIEQEIGEVVVGNDGAVKGDNEDLVAELRHITQDFAQVSQMFHIASKLWSAVAIRRLSLRESTSYRGAKGDCAESSPL